MAKKGLWGIFTEGSRGISAKGLRAMFANFANWAPAGRIFSAGRALSVGRAFSAGWTLKMAGAILVLGVIGLGLAGCTMTAVVPGGSPGTGPGGTPPQGGGTSQYGAISGYVYAPTPVARTGAVSRAGAAGRAESAAAASRVGGDSGAGRAGADLASSRARDARQAGSRPSLAVHKYAVTFSEYSPLNGANILATSQDGHQYSATSRSDGYFTIQVLPPGIYDVAVSHSDFMPVKISGVQVRAGATTPVGEARVGAFHYLFIGINRYLYNQNLNGAVPDARSMFSTFSTSNGLAGEPETLFDDQATKANMRSRITALAGRAEPQDYIMIYFSGHGGQIAGSEPDGWDEFIAPYEASIQDPSSLITDDELEQWLSGSRCKNVVLIFDSCRSGGMTKNARFETGADSAATAPGTGPGAGSPAGGAGSERRPFLPRLSTFARDLTIAGFIVMMASNDNQDSLEIGSSGLFTSSLIEGINTSASNGKRAADANGDGIITAREAFEYARRRTQERARSYGAQQDPQIWPATGRDAAIYRYY